MLFDKASNHLSISGPIHWWYETTIILLTYLLFQKFKKKKEIFEATHQPYRQKPLPPTTDNFPPAPQMIFPFTLITYLLALKS